MAEMVRQIDHFYIEVPNRPRSTALAIRLTSKSIGEIATTVGASPARPSSRGCVAGSRRHSAIPCQSGRHGHQRSLAKK
jgi:hypothetical protein